MSVRKVTRNNQNGKRNSSYRAEVWVSGVRVASKCFDTALHAHSWHDKEKVCRENGLSSERAIAETTFLDCVAQYLREGTAHLMDSSKQSREPRMKYVTQSPLAKIKMVALDAKVIDRWFDWLINTHGHKNPARKSFTHELRLLTIILNWWRNYKDEKFVVPIVRRHRQRAKFRSNTPRRPDYFMRKEEVQSWLIALQSTAKPVYFRLAMLQALTGIRIGEAAGLQWDEVDLNRRLIRITRVVWWDHKTRAPMIRDGAKTPESVRTIILPDPLIAMFREMEAQNGAVGLLFKDKKGDPVRLGPIVKSYNVAFRAAGLDYSGTRILRHTWASNALLATKDLSMVQYNLGHRDQKVTQNYAKVVALAENDATIQTAEFMGFSNEIRA